jgi:hypothetical protein
VWVKRAKPKGCKGINYVSSITRSILEKERKGKLLRAISLERALIATMMHHQNRSGLHFLQSY